MASKSGAIRAGRAFVELFADDSLAVRALNRFQARLSVFGKWVAGYGALFAGMGAGLVAPLLLAGRKFAQMGDEIDKASQRTGMNPESFQELSYAAQQSGASVEDLEGGLRNLSKVLVEARQGGDGAIETLRLLGLTVEDLMDLAPEEAFLRIAEALRNIPNAALRAALAMRLFGRGGTQLIPLLMQGRKRISELGMEARKLGLVLRQDQIEAANRTGDAWSRLLKVLDMAQTILGGTVAPLLETVANGLTINLGPMLSLIEKYQKWVRWILIAGAGLMLLGTVMVQLGAIITGVGKVFGLLASVLQLVLKPVHLLLSLIPLLFTQLTKLAEITLKVSVPLARMALSALDAARALAMLAIQGALQAAQWMGQLAVRALLAAVGLTALAARALLAGAILAGQFAVSALAATAALVTFAVQGIAAAIVGLAQLIPMLATAAVFLSVMFITAIETAFAALTGLTSPLIALTAFAVIAFIALNEVRELLPGLARAAIGAWDALQRWVTSRGDRAGAWIFETFAALRAAGTLALQAISGAIARAFGQLGAAFTWLASLPGDALRWLGQLTTQMVFFVSQIPAALATVWGVLASGLRQFSGWVSQAFWHLVGEGKRAFGAIAGALMAGNLEAAANVVWAGLKLIWLEGGNWLRQGWTDFLNWFNNATGGIFQNVGKMWRDTVKGILKTYVLVQNALGLVPDAGLEKAQLMIDVAFGVNEALIEEARKQKIAAQLQTTAKTQAELEAARLAFAEAVKKAEAAGKEGPAGLLKQFGLEGFNFEDLMGGLDMGGLNLTGGAGGTFSSAAGRMFASGNPVLGRFDRLIEIQRQALHATQGINEVR